MATWVSQPQLKKNLNGRKSYDWSASIDSAWGGEVRYACGTKGDKYSIEAVYEFPEITKTANYRLYAYFPGKSEYFHYRNDGKGHWRNSIDGATDFTGHQTVENQFGGWTEIDFRKEKKRWRDEGKKILQLKRGDSLTFTIDNGGGKAPIVSREEGFKGCGRDNRVVFPPLLLVNHDRARANGQDLVPFDPVRDLNPYAERIYRGCMSQRAEVKLSLTTTILYSVDTFFNVVAAHFGESATIFGTEKLVVGERRWAQRKKFNHCVGQTYIASLRCNRDPAGLKPYVPDLGYWVYDMRYLNNNNLGIFSFKKDGGDIVPQSFHIYRVQAEGNLDVAVPEPVLDESCEREMEIRTPYELLHWVDCKISDRYNACESKNRTHRLQDLARARKSITRARTALTPITYAALLKERDDGETSESRVSRSEPSAPRGLSLSAGDGEITASWSAPDDNGASIDRFEVRWRRTGGSSWSKQAVSGSSSGYTVGGLRDGTAYEVQVRARNSVGWSDWSRSRSATPKTAASAPGAPPGMSVTAGDGQVDVSWGAAAQNSSPVTGYTVSWSGNGVADGSSQLGASARSYTITGLTNGAGYTVSVVAHSAVGDSAASSLAAFPKAAARVPDAPRSLSVTAGDGDIEVSWRASLENGAAVTGYRVAWSDGVAIGWKDRSASARSYTIPGLRNGTRYEVSVVAQSSAGMSSVSTGYVTPVAKAAKPCTPRRPSLSGGEGGITASWAAPCDNGAAIDRYQVRWRRSGQSSWSDWAGSGSSRSRTISGLRDGATYEVQVRARNSVGWSDWSSSATAATDDADAGSVSVSAGPVNTSRTGKGSCGSGNDCHDLRYTISGLGSGPYALECWFDGRREWRGQWSGKASTGCFYSSAFSGAVHVVVDGVKSNTISLTGRLPVSAPDAPGRPSLAAGDGEIAVSWSPPGDNGASIDRYEVRWRRSGGSSWSKQAVAGSTSRHEVTGLSNGVSYEVRVRARNGVGWSDWSPSATATPEDAATPPDAPPGLAVTAGDGEMAVSWRASRDNGAAVTGYSVRWSGDGVSDSRRLGASARNHVITGLRNGAGYTVSVVAHSVVGDSAASSLAAFPKAPARVPDAPRGLSLTAGDGEMAVSWQASRENGAAVTGYLVAWSDGVVIGGETLSASARSYTITGLRSGVRYEVEVAAQSSAGTSQSATAYATTKAAVAVSVPDAPSRPTLRDDDGSVQVSWSAPADNGASIDRYEVRYRRSGRTSWSDWDGSGSSRRLRITGTSAGTTYEAQVRARNSEGWGPWSPTATVTTQQSQASVAISAGPVNSRRTNQGSCGANDCHDLRYTIRGLGNGPYATECWFNGRLPAGASFTWSGNASTGCYYWSTFRGTIYVVVDGVKSNTITIR